MAFRTKLDYSDNRQINQRQRTFTNLEGGSVFGVAYSAMTSGVGTTCSATTDEYVFTGSTFSGNGTTTMYTWFDPRMEIAAYTLSALTSSNSGETQNTGNVFVIDTTATTVDGYIYALTYTGTSFDLSVDTMYSGAGPVFTGTVTHDFIQFLSACSLDYTGTTMWIDNPEKTRTKKLVITENATPNHVWTCVNADGLGGWLPSSGGTTGSTDTFVTGGTLNGTNLDLTWNTGGSVPSIDLSSLSASTNFANTDLTLTGDRVHDLSGYTVTLKDEKDDQTRLIVENLFNGGSANSAVSVRSRGAGAVTISGTILYGGDSFNGYGSFTDGGSGLLTNAFSMTSLGGTPSQRGNINIGSRRGTDAEVRIFNGGDDFDFTSLGAKFTTTGFTSYQDVYIDNLPSESVLGTDANGKIIAGSSPWTAGTANNTAALIGYTGLTNNPDTAYFKHGVTDIISGSTWSGNTINMDDGTNSPLTISHEDQFGGTEFLKLDSTVLLQRSVSNYLSITNGVGTLRASSQNAFQAGNSKLQTETSFGIWTNVNNAGSSGSLHVFKTNNSGGNLTSVDLHDGALQGDIVFGIPKAGTFDYDGVFGSGLGSSATGNTGKDYQPIFISSPRGEARDTTSYNTILNTAFVGGSDHTMYSGITDSVFIGGTGNTISTGVIRTVVIGGKDITGDTSDMVYVPDLVIDGLNSTDPLATDANGKIIAGASDARLKTNINNLESALDKVLNLRGVSYEWTEESNMGAGITKYGLIAQEVQKVIPDMVRLRAKADDTLTLSYTEIVPWLIEAVKELASDDSPLIKREELILETQTISSEDNNIELNFNGNHGSALNGGIKVVKGVNETTDSEFKINSDGDWVTNNYIKPFGLKLPRFTPTSTNDKKGKLGEVTRDNDYIYIKSESGWKRTNLETF